MRDISVAWSDVSDDTSSNPNKQQTHAALVPADLRLEDNAALLTAVERAKPVIPVFIWSPKEEKPWPPGAASRWWLHQSLAKLQVALVKRGSNLVLWSGPTETTIERLVHETRAGAIYWNRRYEPSVVERDSNLKDALRRAGIAAESFSGSLSASTNVSQNHAAPSCLANNTLGWQWVAGCGADAAPYFRIFNPVSQGTKFDPKGDYVRRWVPELADMSGASIHRLLDESIQIDWATRHAGRGISFQTRLP